MASKKVFGFLLRYTLVRRFLLKVLRILLRYAWLRRFEAWLFIPFPKIKDKLVMFVRTGDVINSPLNAGKAPSKARQYQHGLTDSVKVHTGHLSKQNISPQDKHNIKRVIYYWIDFTSKCPTNTGCQRVTRRLARTLMESGARIIFVCWDEKEKTLIKATRLELEHLSRWNGPQFSREFLDCYPNSIEPIDVSCREIRNDQLTDAWLFIPEITHITTNNTPPTPNAINYAKAHGMKVAFIFYDAIPLKLKEYADSATLHTEYMQQIALADLIIPISQFSAADLTRFYLNEFHLDEETLPIIKPLSLPGDSFSIPRAPKYRSVHNELLILSVGTIDIRKNQVTLIKAFNNLCVRYPSAPLKLILCGNLHPRLKSAIFQLINDNPKIMHINDVSDKKLFDLYKKCSITVFPSVEEGFGLPIIESLWFGKPVICANFGAMVEAAEGGGCITVDTRSIIEMESAMEKLLFDSLLREKLAKEAISRPLLSWREYGMSVFTTLDSLKNQVTTINKVYYWVDHTCWYPSNSGIQRVTRGLARALQEIGIQLVPVRWNNISKSFYYPDSQQFLNLSRWNGPDPSKFNYISLAEDEPNSWLLIPELTSYLEGSSLDDVTQIARSKGMRAAIIFYDAIPHKLAQFYLPHETAAHVDYMRKLINFDLVFPISNTSSLDLKAFLHSQKILPSNVETEIVPVSLPGEFLEHPRVLTYEEPLSDTIRVLSVGTVEPRKNHLLLLEAFDRISQQGLLNIELILVGGCPIPFKELERKVRNFIERNNRIHWLRNVDDNILAREYANCHFTVYPSLDEGFGLPILESLWYARPCICRNTSAMAEVAEGGGCLTVDTSRVDELAKAILLLAQDKELRAKLGKEAVTRHLRTWAEYANEILRYLVKKQ